ncbi:MAG: dependent oxidoreductase [Ilumatobacteraceae bacterium]|nr:dependent oxidoreductase [Ilumatobacteraceae bacterium]
MNVRACRLSAFDDEPDHFMQWMAEQGSPIHPDDFARRMDYGQYLRSVSATESSALTVQRIHQRCTGIDHAAGADSGAVTITFDNGQHVDADHVVLALGNARPVPLAGPANSMVQDPWDEAALGQIGPADDVVIVGTGLTAVDTLLALEASGHRGRTTVVSRHGRWPAAHIGAPLTCVVPSGRPIEFASFGLHPTARSIVSAVRRALAERGDDEWQNVIDRVRPHTVRLWRALDDAERARFVRHARPLWEAHRHRMAPAIADRLSQIVSNGRTDTIAGHLTSIVADDDRACVTLQRADGPQTITARWVINCTGPSSDIRRRDDAFIECLLSFGHATAAWRGWGLDVDDCGRMQHCSDVGSTSISAIGPLRLGADYETTAIPEIRLQAASLALRLASRPARANVA